MQWKPNVTVSAIIQQEGKFLLVEEYVGRRLVLNQPAGHLENNESILDAAIREVREETTREFYPSSIVGIYHYPHPHDKDTMYLRFCLFGNCGPPRPQYTLDDGIVKTIWLSRHAFLEDGNYLDECDVGLILWLWLWLWHATIVEKPTVYNKYAERIGKKIPDRSRKLSAISYSNRV